MNYQFELINDLRETHSTDDFVREYKNNISPKVCQKIINLFEKQTDLSSPGHTGGGFDVEVKDSLDLNIGFAAENCKSEKRREKWLKLDSILCDALSKAVNEYYEELSVFKKKYHTKGNPFPRPPLQDTGYQIQKTTPESGGYVPHNDSYTEQADRS